MATDQAGIAKAAAAAISQMAQASEGAAKSQKKQNDLIREFNELAKEKIDNDKEMSENQLNFTEKINEELDKLRDNYETISITIEKICNELHAAIGSVKIFTKETKAAARAVKSLQQAQAGNSSIFAGFGDILGSIGDIANGAFGAVSKGFGKLFGAGKSAIGAVGGVAKSFMSMNPLLGVAGFLLKGMFNLFTKGIKIAAKFATAMIGLPLQITRSVAKIGHAFRTEVVETIGNAVESVKEFVDVNDGLGKSIKDMSTSSAMSLDKFLDPTSDLVKMFGYGPAGLANAIQQSGQALKDMGILVDVAGGSIAKNITHFTQATRSLGMSGEDVAYVTAEAVKNGESIYAVLDRFTVANNNVANQFGIDRKKLSLNFLELRKDITNFGHLSDKELMQTSARLTQLGVDMGAAKAVFSKMDTFESAAQSAAMLSQTFGMNLDALQLLRAEKPEEIIEQFRDAMLATGRSFDDLNRHEKSLMESHTGLNAQQLKMTMNYRTMGMSYADIQKKMKEDDPTQQQIKNLKLMSGSLKEIQKTLQGDNIFKNFSNGVLESMKAASGLSPILLRVSKRFEDFFVAGLKVSKGTKSALMKAFKPFTDVLEDMVGDGKKKKGLLDANRFKGTFEKFTVDIGSFLGRVFSGKETLGNLQKEFSEKATKIFSFASFNKGNNFAGTLMKSGGKIVGQLLKALTAIGPGLINVFATTLEDLVNWLDSDITSGNNALANTFSKLFSISKKDGIAMTKGLTDIFDTIVEKILPSLFKLSKPIFKFVYDAVTTIVSTAWNAVTKKLEGTSLGAALFSIKSGQAEAAEEKKISKLLGMDVADIDNNLIAKLTKGYDLEQARGVGQLQAIVEKNLNKTSTTVAERKELEKVSLMLKEIVDTKMYKRDSLGDYDNYIKKSLDTLEKYSSSRGIVLDIGKVKDDVTSVTGKNGIGIIKKVGKNKAVVKQTAAGDQTITGKDGGPVVNAIAYAGNAANAALEGIQGVVSALTGAPAPPSGGGGLSEIRIFMQVDGNTLTEVVLDNDLIRKATQRKNGRTTLADGTVIDSAGSRIQGSSLT